MLDTQNVLMLSVFTVIYDWLLLIYLSYSKCFIACDLLNSHVTQLAP
jgi:hypothetical protein